MDIQHAILYVVFTVGIVSLYLSVAAFSTNRMNPGALPLAPIGFFAAGIAVTAVVWLVGEFIGDTTWIAALVPRLLIASAILLCEAPRRLLIPRARLWFYIPVAAIGAGAAVLAAPALSYAAQWFLAVALFATGAALLRTAAHAGQDHRGRWRGVGVCMLALAAVVLLGPSTSASAPWAIVAAVRFAAAAVLIFGVATVILLAPASFRTAQIRMFARVRGVTLVVLAVVLAAGLPYFGMRVRVAFDELRTEEQQTLVATQDSLAANFARTDILARLLASDDAVRAFLAAPGAATRTAAHKAIDRNASAQPSGVAYLLDARGVVVAGSDRALPESQVGASLADEPFFSDAVIGYQGRQLEVGGTPRKRAYLSSAQVRGADGRLVGVALTEADVDVWNLVPEGPAIVMLVRGDGVVFLSSSAQWELRSLWPRSARGSRLSAPPPLLALEPGDGELATLGSHRVLISRGPISLPDWSLVILSAAQEMNNQIQIGLGTVFAIAVTVLFFLAILHVVVVSNGRLALAESRYRTVVEGAPLWISVLDAERRIVVANSAGDAAWSGQGLVGRSFLELWPVNDRSRLAQALQRADAGETVVLELPAAGRSQEPMIWRLSIMTVGPVDSGERQVLVLGEDVTAQRAAQRQALVTEHLAAVGTLAAGIAHRFNNINMGVLAGLEALERMPEGSPQRASIVQKAKSLVLLGGSISDKLLEFASPGSDVRERVLLGAIVREAADLLEESLRGEGIDFRLRLDDAPILADTGRMKFVVVSLLTNARDAVAERETRLIDISTGTRDDTAFLRVADSGQGLPEGTMTQLYNPFYTTKGEWAEPGSASARARGMGLSLFVCQGIVHDHGGSIDAGNGPDGGAVFTVRLPLAPAG